MNSAQIEYYLTTGDRQALVQRQPLSAVTDDAALPLLTVDVAQRWQTMEGFGLSLTGGSAYLLSRLPDWQRRALWQELFSREGVGISCLRLTIGASDLSATAFSYAEMPPGEMDWTLAGFDLSAGDVEVVPMLREILAINPALRLIATPWSAPRWMKTNQAWVGGQLRPDCYRVYAEYLRRYLQAMQAAGITVHAITPQNEPLNAKNEPSMVMAAAEQAVFIKQHLGPVLRAAGLATEIFCWDHNCDRPDYALQVLGDAEARAYIAGSAWHLYGGEIGALRQVQQAYPGQRLYFTEQWVGRDGQFGGDLRWHAVNVLIGATRNGCSVVLEWNLAGDADCGPHTPGGEPNCVGALTLAAGQVERNVAYYLLAHSAGFVPPGSVRVAVDAPSGWAAVAFLTPTGQAVLLLCNDSDSTQSLRVACAGLTAAPRLPAGALATLVFKPGN